MPKRKKYDFELLQKYCSENNVVLLEDYKNDYFTKNFSIKGKCAYENCNNVFEKNFINLIKAGGYCKSCIKIVTKERVKETLVNRYGGENNKNKMELDKLRKCKVHKITLNKIQVYCEENNIELVNDYNNCYLNTKSYVRTKCNYDNCLSILEKSISQIMKTGSYCDVCKNIIKLEKSKNTCFKKYGVEYSSQSKEVQDKYKQTCLEKYGVEHTFQSELVKNKIKEFCLEKYGFENAIKNKEVKEKAKKTCLEKYGVEHSLQNKEIMCKFKNTCLEKFGVENPSQNKNIKNKKIETSLKNWGVEFPSQNEVIKNKMKETNILNLGVEYPTQNETVKNKAKQTNLTKFGVEYTFQSETVKNKIKETNLQNLGVEYPSQNEDIRNKIKETNLQNLGVKYPSQNEEVQNKTKQTCLEKYGCEYSFQSEDIKNKTKQTCLEKYGYEHPFQNSEIMEKSIKQNYKKKEYTFPSNKIIEIQGYESFALDELIINEKIDESDIITGIQNVPVIWYNDETGKKHRHYVDIFIPSQNKCIEVKSIWSYEKQIDIVLLKQKAAKELGYKYSIWVYNNKKEKVNCYD